MAILEVSDLTMIYPPPRQPLFSVLLGRSARAGPVTALRHVSLTIEPGEILGLLGPNGAGKTTLCKILCGIVLPTSGRATINGLDVVRDHHEITKQAFAVFGGETEMWGLFSWRLSVRKNLEIVAGLWNVPRRERQQRIASSLEAVGLVGKEREWYQKLSAGEKQKVWLAALLVVAPKLAILDEPTIRLDVHSRRLFYEILSDWLVKEQGGSVLLTSHHLNEIEDVCDRVAILDRGRLVALGPVKRILSGLSEERIVLEISMGESDFDFEGWKSKGIRFSSDPSKVEDLLSEGKAVSVECPEELLAGFTRSVIEAGGMILSVNRTRPSLEEAFLRIVEREAGRNDRQQIG